MGQLLVIRHGETEWNREEVFRGRVDVGLSARGRRQAELVAGTLRGTPIEAVYSSPLARARDTAGPVGESKGLRVVLDERLVDMNFGEWEGRARAEIESGQPELYRRWMEEPEHFRAPGGESLPEVVARAWPALEEIGARHAQGVAVVLSHRVVCKLVLCKAMGVGEAGFWRVRVETASISALETAGRKWVVTQVNDTHHLAALGSADRADF
jgi:probable phosphoglycerate mutase